MEQPKRKPTRLGNYDYSSGGGYFITICTHGKKHILSQIIPTPAQTAGNVPIPNIVQPDVGVGVPDDPQSRADCAGNVPIPFTAQPDVGVGVPDDPQNKLTEYGKIAEKYINRMNEFYETVNVDKYVIMPNHIHMLLSVNNPNRESECGTSRTPSPTNSIIPKFVSSFKRFCNKEISKNIWQRSYHDHIIRDEKDYLKIWGYIDTNVIRWKNDCFYDE